RSHMKLVKQMGLFTTFSSKDIYHKEKLEADLDRLRVLVYADNGYLKTRFGEPRVEEVGKVGSWIPIVGHKGQGLKIVIPVEEGKQYTLHRLEFIGNTFTRDNVLRREVLLNEGERYNEQLWDLSILRLNQLGYFNPVKKEDATINTNEKEGQVDITMKVEEKGRQQISFTGGVSGVGGSYLGIDYSTNNLLGYGESLALALSGGNYQKVASFSFTEPYLKGRPISLGFSVFYQNYQFIGQGFGAITSSNIFGGFQGESLFTQRTKGASVSASAPLSYFAKRFRMGRF